MSPGSLSDYRAKRDFESTPEPRGDGAAAREDEGRGRKDEGRGRKRAKAPADGGRGRKRAKAPADGGPGNRARAQARSPSPSAQGARFVVHEHHARRLHWDLRLEHDGVLLSWAIPNGIPQDPRHNRKAIHTEDHPLEYLGFKGEIPQGSYGAGRMLIWDSGRYEAEKLRDGEVIAVFHGKRLRGRYALFRTGAENDWMIHRMDPPEGPNEPMPERVVPMLATLAARVPREEAAWSFEVKWDGVRAITYWRPGRMRIESRNLNDVTARYPELRALGEELGSHEAVLDGEIVSLDEAGRPSFERLQRRMHVGSESAVRRLAREAPVTYMVFDLLYLDGRLTMDRPYSERRRLLEGLGLDGPRWQTPAAHVGDGAALLKATAELGLEGVIAKRLDSPYRPGDRGREWLKIKNVNRQELVIGGWLPGKGTRAGRIGALLVGYHDEDARGGELRYAGRVGTGFDAAELRLLGEALDARAVDASPFVSGPPPPRGARFVRPELVAEVEFAEWTREGVLRAPSYKGLREDKRAEDVVAERPAAYGRGSARAPRGPSPGAREQQAPGASAQGDRKAKGRRRRAAPYRVLRETARTTQIEIEGRTLRLSNRDKVLYPRAGFTKGQLIDYYAAVAPAVLPHLAGRPLTMKRYPEGVEGGHFFEKRCPPHRPEWVKTAAVWSAQNNAYIDYCIVEDAATLVWAANLADIELHTSLARAEDVQRPTALVFDLDPGAPAGMRECCRVALLIRELLDAFSLRSVVKTSGSKGAQLYVPLNLPTSYERTKPFARAVAQLLEQRHPDLVVSRMTKSLRPGKVLIDWSQNDPHKTTVCVYSMRARERPTISTPLRWEEVERAARRRSQPTLSLEPDALLRSIDREGDLFEPLLSVRQELPDLDDAAV